jgi:arylformamidase
MLATAAAVAASPAAAQECRLGPPPHHQGPPVFLNYDQIELDASYDQAYYEPLIGQVVKRQASNSEAARAPSARRSA